MDNVVNQAFGVLQPLKILFIIGGTLLIKANIIDIESRRKLGGKKMTTKEKTLMDLINADDYLSSSCADIENKALISNGDTSLSKAFAAYKFALENPDIPYTPDKRG